MGDAAKCEAPCRGEAEGNRRRQRRVEEVLARLLAQTCHAGYYGTAAVEWDVLDGDIREVREVQRRNHR